MADPIDSISWREQALQEQIAAWHKLINSEVGAQALLEAGTDHASVLRPLFDKLRRLYVEDLPIAKLQENSDIVIHIEGPEIHGQNPQLKAVNWLGNTVRTQFSRLAAAVIPGMDQKTAAAARRAQWDITGLVPGSIYMGFALHRPKSRAGFESGDTEISDLIVDAAQSVSMVPQFIEDTGVNQGLTEVITDPALRDAAMMAAMQFAPTKKSHFDSVEILVPGVARGILHNQERMALRHALIKPMMRKKQSGSFIGELNEIDLDSTRFQLRNVAGVGTIRCVMDFTPAHGRRWLGHRVKVTGIYDTDSSGRPRLMRVSDIDVIQPQSEIN